MYHIKDGKRTLCGYKVSKGMNVISMNSASRATLANCCSKCKTIYTEKLKQLVDFKRNG